MNTTLVLNINHYSLKDTLAHSIFYRLASIQQLGTIEQVCKHWKGLTFNTYHKIAQEKGIKTQNLSSEEVRKEVIYEFLKEEYFPPYIASEITGRQLLSFERITLSQRIALQNSSAYPDHFWNPFVNSHSENPKHSDISSARFIGFKINPTVVTQEVKDLIVIFYFCRDQATEVGAFLTDIENDRITLLPTKLRDDQVKTLFTKIINNERLSNSHFDRHFFDELPTNIEYQIKTPISNT